MKIENAISRKFHARYDSLKAVVDSSDQKKKERAIEYMAELEVMGNTYCTDGLMVDVVPKHVLDNMVARAEFATFLYEGKHCQAVLIKNCPYEDWILIHMAPAQP